MYGSNCSFLTCIQISQETGKVISTPISGRIFQFVVIHTIKGFRIVKEAQVFLELPRFLHDPMNVSNLTLVPLPLQNLAGTPFLFFTLILFSLFLFVFISLARNLSLLLSFPKSCDLGFVNFFCCFLFLFLYFLFPTYSEFAFLCLAF